MKQTTRIILRMIQKNKVNIIKVTESIIFYRDKDYGSLIFFSRYSIYLSNFLLLMCKNQQLSESIVYQCLFL